jgi:hypothetical protein
MPSELPAKIWVQICEKYSLSKSDLLSLSSTNRELREQTLPLPFQDVEFQGFPQAVVEESEETREPYNRSLAPFYTRIHKRVDWLQNQPHLLPYVRTCRLYGWSHLSALLDDDPDVLYSPLYGDALDCWLSAYEVLIGLITLLPSLRVLALAGSPITPALQSAIYLSPRLESLVLSACESEVGRSTIPRRQVAVRLHDLVYQPPPANSEHLDPNFKQLLRRCLPSLISLKLSMDSVVGVAAIVSTHRHTLQHLVISESPFGPIGIEKASAVYNLLKSCAGLKTLKIIGWVDCDLPELGEHAPPNLDYISGTSTVFQALVPGRPIHSVHLQYCPLDPLTPSSFDLSQPSTVTVRRVYIDYGSNLPADVITALGSAFRHLTHLKIRFLRGYRINNRNAAIGVCILLMLQYWRWNF